MTRRTKVCGAWSQDWGRDTHVCTLPPHSGEHACKCAARWTGPDRRATRRRPVTRRDVLLRLIVAVMFAAAFLLTDWRNGWPT